MSKNNQQKTHSNFIAKIINFLNSVIENKFFKPFSLSIIVVAVLFFLQQYSGFLINYYQQVKKQKSLTNPIKINISQDHINVSLIEEQTIDYIIKPNDNLLKIFTDLGSNNQDSLAIIEEIKKVKPNYPLNSGNIIKITYSVQIDYHQAQQNQPLKPIILPQKTDKKSPKKLNKNQQKSATKKSKKVDNTEKKYD